MKQGSKQYFLEFKNKHDKLLNKMNNVLSNFERSMLTFDDLISSRVLDLALTITKKTLEDTYLNNSQIILKNLKKIFNKEKFSIKNPILFINSKDKVLIESNFEYIFSQYKWSICIDDNLLSGDFLISSQDLTLDARMSTYLNELFQLAFLKKK